MEIISSLPSSYYLRLYDYYKNARRSKLFEWIAVGEMEFLALLNYPENYEYILNRLGQGSIYTEHIPNRGSFKNVSFNFGKGLNFSHEPEMYDSGPWQPNSAFMIELKNLFKRTVKHIDESFISIPPILMLPGNSIDDSKKIIPNNFYRQGIQFDYMIDQIYPRKKITTILEIGGGLGNMAHFQKKYDPKSKCILLDIPHTLLIQYHFLYTLGYNCVLLDDTDDINQIISDGNFDILLILPHHIEKINDGSIDLLINFDSLVEMNATTTTYYVDHAVRISKYIYTVNQMQSGIEGRVLLDTFTKHHNKLRLLDMKDQVYSGHKSDASDYFFWIGLSPGYKIMLFETY